MVNGSLYRIVLVIFRFIPRYERELSVSSTDSGVSVPSGCETPTETTQKTESAYADEVTHLHLIKIESNFSAHRMSPVLFDVLQRLPRTTNDCIARSRGVANATRSCRSIVSVVTSAGEFSS